MASKKPWAKWIRLTSTREPEARVVEEEVLETLEEVMVRVGHADLLRRGARGEKRGTRPPAQRFALSGSAPGSLRPAGDRGLASRPALTTCWRVSARRGIRIGAMTLDFGINTGFVEELYAQYLENPASVDAELARRTSTRASPPRAGRPGTRTAASPDQRRAGAGASERAFARTLVGRRALAARRRTSATSLAEAAIQARVYKLLNAYRVRGHLFAHVDPLGIRPSAPRPSSISRNFDLLPRGPRQALPHHRPRRHAAGGHAARDPPRPGGDVLPHHRRRVHPHRGPRAARLAPGADGVDAGTASRSARRSSSASSPS